MEAVIFDMDGVIIDAEPLWQRAEKVVFSSLGVLLDEYSCNLTQAMTTTEVTHFWYSRYPWEGKSLREVEKAVIMKVKELIEKEDCAIEGIKEVLKQLKTKGFKIGLATNSPFEIIYAVLNKLGIYGFFDVVSSAEFEKQGKPHPDVYLSTLKKLNVLPSQCIAIEDSNSGIKAAKGAGVKAIAFKKSQQSAITEKTDFEIQGFQDVDYAIFD